eukprot:CAMPEP_0183789792 /NCGR_PEP_ID=MMETSP0803_2-20130417/644_1 /TAXON_ID=195967 /ORGANISM="Crustomastix stigmata, Strain CCMP3273" /LENGTH=195 /DNA_ID=CAMNT_0026033973 /DNA_START=57 /DNA_END=641 /DNA_ORIENTATION=+
MAKAKDKKEKKAPATRKTPAKAALTPKGASTKKKAKDKATPATWTSSQTKALKAAVEKYGTGKWSAILKDEKFGAQLGSFSANQLKDKYKASVGLAKDKTTTVKSPAAKAPGSAKKAAPKSAKKEAPKSAKKATPKAKAAPKSAAKSGSKKKSPGGGEPSSKRAKVEPVPMPAMPDPVVETSAGEEKKKGGCVIM